MKKEISKKTLLYVHPVFIIGSYDQNKNPNIMAVSWGGICCSEPPCMTISLRKATHSFSNLMESKAYTVNMPASDQVSEADFTGIYSGRDMNKFERLGLEPKPSDYVNAPEVAEFPVTMHCEVIKTVELGLHTQFIGQIKGVTASESVLNENSMPDIEKINPFVYDSATRSYFQIGKLLGKAYSVGKK